MLRLPSVVALVLLGIAGCATPPPSTGPSPSVTPGASSSPATRPAGYEEFTSGAVAYRTCYPESWVPLERVAFDDGPDGDMFVGPPGDVVNLVATIVSEPAGQLGSASYAEAAIQNLRGRGIGVRRADPIVVDGAAATVVTFPRLSPGGQRYTVRETIWVSGGRGWVHIIVYDPPLEPHAIAVADAMLGCFRSA